MNKKKTFVIAVLVVILSILTTGTLAYFTTRAVVHNVITTSGVDITLIEDFEGAQPNADGSMQLDGVMPGDSHPKAVRVHNEKEEAWIRVRVTLSFDKNLDADEVTDIAFNLGTRANQWTKGDGWYYYNSPVPTGGETSDLFENVEFKGPEMDNAYQNAKLTIEVEAQAVQTANNPIPEGGNVTDIQGWPKDGLSTLFG